MNKTTNSKRKSLIIGSLIFITLVLLISLGPYYGIQKIATFGLMPLMMAIAISYDFHTLNQGSIEIKLFFLLFILSLISIYYYVNLDSLIIGLSALSGALVAGYISIGINKNRNFESYFHVGYIVSIILLVIIMYSRGNISFTNFATVNDRSRFLLNANFYSYISYFANFSLFYLYLKRKNVLVLILLLILPVVFIIVAFATQSRSAILFIVVTNVCFWFFINKSENKSVIIKMFRTFIYGVILIIGAIYFFKTFETSQIKNRVESNESSRQVLAMRGLKYFTENPLLGSGLSQFPHVTESGKFTHNSYSEALAEHGIFGGLLLLLIFGIPTIKSIKNFRKYSNNVFIRLNLLFFITFLAYNNFYVFYKFSFSMFYFFLIINIQNKLTIELNNQSQAVLK